MNVIWKNVIFLEVIALQMLVFSVHTCMSCTLGGTLFPQE